MVQVDVFWSYALGAGLALAAARQLASSEPSPGTSSEWEKTGRDLPQDSRSPADPRGGRSAGAGSTTVPPLESSWKRDAQAILSLPYFSVTLLYLGLLFAPSGAYLLWGFTSWETMHADLGTLPAWLVTAFALTNVSQGALGFLLAYRAIRRGCSYLAYLHMVLAYFCMFFILVHGWDGLGYQRFFSPTRADFSPDWSWITAVRWFSADIALTLYGMGVIILPVLFWLMSAWIRTGVRSSSSSAFPSRPGQPSYLHTTFYVLASALGAALGLAILSSLLIHALGLLFGLPCAVALVYGLGVHPRGVFLRLCRALLWMPATSPLK